MGTPNDFTKLLICLVTPAQDIENAYQQLLTLRGINTAVGVQLDQVGSLVGQARLGLDDDDYRRYIRARIVVNRSNGKYEQLIQICRLVINDPAATVSVQRAGTATVVATIDGPLSIDIAEILAALLEQAKAAGVRILTESSTVPPASTFRFDSGPGWDVGHLAYALE